MKAFIVLIVLSVQDITSAFLSSSSESSEDEFNEQTIIQSLIRKDNEVQIKDVPERDVEPRSPQYPIEILKQFELKSMSDSQVFNKGRNMDNGGGTITLKVNNKTFSKPRNRIFHVWLPVEILEATTANRTIVRFQQTLSRAYFGNFTSSQITLTLMDVQLSGRTFLKMFTQWGNDELENESVQRMHIEQGKKFYSFNITDFISQRLKENLTEPNFINIGFQVFEVHGRSMRQFDFNRLFDVQVDMPLIMYFYGGFIPSEINLESSARMRRSVGKRNIYNARPPTQCQRRSFSVKPEEVDWNNVVEPKVLDLGYCSGTCPFPLEDTYYNFSLHSFLIDRYRLHHVLSAPKDFPHSTCIPLKYKAISVLERTGPDQIEAGAVHNLLVDTCGCR